jgi:phytoene desaturase
MQRKKAIIIGSGVSGLAAAIRLSVNNFDVEVFESNDYPGGKLSVFEKKGYRFDAGPSLFTQPDLIEDIFSCANEPIEPYFTYQKADVSCRYFFENGKRITGYADKQKFGEELVVQCNENPGVLNQYLDEAEKLYNNIGRIFLDYSLHKKETWFQRKITKAIFSLKSSYLFGTMNSHNKSVFLSEETVQLFNRFATYNGSNPYKAPGMLSVIPHLEMNQGTFYPKGGMISITNALYNLALKKGVQFRFCSPVTQIITKENKAIGILSNNENHLADLIVSNADVYKTYKHLLGNENKTQKLSKLERSSSALIFYWGIKKEFSALGLHNILFSKNYQEEFKHLFEHKTLYEDPTIYINITSKMETGQAPEGCENWFVMINAPANYGQDWKDITHKARKAAIEKINRLLGTDIEEAIETETIMDPVVIEEKTGTHLGSLYGTSSNSKWAAFLRPANFSNKIKGLYFCGGTVHPGGGIPLCLKSAQITTELIKKDHEKKH